MHIEIWSIGKANGPFILEGIQHYFQKTKPYNSIDLQIIPSLKKNTI